jgi:hypothetical protein
LDPYGELLYTINAVSFFETSEGVHQNRGV